MNPWKWQRLLFLSFMPLVTGRRIKDSKSGECGIREQAGITRCAEPLYRIHAFHPDSSSQTFTWDFFAAKSPDYFPLVCKTFQDFKHCVEPYREPCFYSEPIKSQYGTAVVILEYLCGDVEPEAALHMRCFGRAVEQWDMGKCQALMVTGLERLQSIHIPRRQERQLCTTMRQYSECIRFPLKRVCGERAWDLAQEMIARPTHLLLPQCSLRRSARFAARAGGERVCGSWMWSILVASLVVLIV